VKIFAVKEKNNMNTTRKLLWIFVAAFTIMSFNSCLVRHSESRKWVKKRNRAYYYKQNGGRRLWVRDNFRNTR